MEDSAYKDRVVDVMEELYKFTLLLRDKTDYLTYYLTVRYCERKEKGNHEIIKTHIPQVRSQNVIYLKYEFFRITNQSTRYRAVMHSGRDY